MTRARPGLSPATWGSIVGAAVLGSTFTAQAARPKAKPHPPSAPSTPISPSNAPAASIAVTVVETAGSRAYVQPGATAGVHRGATVTVQGKEYAVIDGSDSFAVVEMGDEPLHEHETGRANRVEQEEQKVVELSKPRPLQGWKGAWTPEAAPADAQEPRLVPLGDAERNRRFDVRFALAAGGVVPLGGQLGSSLGEAELNMRLHAEPLEAPITVNVDASLQGWVAADLASRVGASTRPALYVRELLATYNPGSLYAGVGRMPYAASTLGTLDGIRVEKGFGGGLTVGAFGGFLPNPLSGAPSADAQRFGVEARYSRPDLDLRPEAAVVVHGSTFNGGLDERRVSALFSLFPGPSRFGGYVEVSSFDASNPWHAGTVELTAAGVDESLRVGSFELGARFDVRQPERSRWLATFLPMSWFCTTVPAPAANPLATEPCNGNVSTSAFGEIDASVAIGNLSLAVGGLTVSDLTEQAEPSTFGGFASARVARIAKAYRLDVSANYSQSTFVNMAGGSAGPGVTLMDDVLDVSAYYRINVLRYAVDSASLLQQGVGGTFVILPSSELLFTLQGESIVGDDAKVLTMFATVVWRPRL